MLDGSIYSSFSAGSDEFDTVDVNIYGKICCTYHYYGSCTIQCPSDRLMDIIESLVDKFVIMLPNVVDCEYDTIHFFGDIHAIDDQIKSFPLYFILSGKTFNLFQINPKDTSDIVLIETSCCFDDLLDRLNEINSNLLEEYYDDDEEYDDDDDDEYGDDVEDYDDVFSIFEGDYSNNIEGNFCGVINGNMWGDIEGDLIGVINGDMYGKVEGDLKGVINGNMRGNIEGDLTGTVNGDMFGNIEGCLIGRVEGVMYGHIQGDIDG